MLSIVLSILTFGLIAVSLFLILIVLAQKAKTDGGVGAALGGGMAEATFGADTSNVLSRMTRYAAVIFFVLSLTLYLGRIRESRAESGGALPAISGPTAPATLPEAPAANATSAPPAGTTPAPAPGTTTPAPAAPAAPATP